MANLQDRREWKNDNLATNKSRIDQGQARPLESETTINNLRISKMGIYILKFSLPVTSADTLL